MREVKPGLDLTKHLCVLQLLHSINGIIYKYITVGDGAAFIVNTAGLDLVLCPSPLSVIQCIVTQ